MNVIRTSWIAPIALTVIVASFFLFLTRKINGTCCAMLIICTGLFMLVLYPIAAAVENTAQAVTRVGQQQITFSKGQERKAKCDLWFLVASVAFLIVQAILVGFELMRFLHGH